jgi:hypothetical protein
MKKLLRWLLGGFGSQNRPSNSVSSGATQDLGSRAILQSALHNPYTGSRGLYSYEEPVCLAMLAKMSECFYGGEQFEPLQFPVMDSILDHNDGLVHLSIPGNEALPPQSVVIGRVNGCYGIFEGEIAHTSVNGRHRVNPITDIERSIELYIQEDRACVLRSFDIIGSSQVNNKFGGVLTEKILEIFNGNSQEPIIRIIRQGDTQFTPYPLEGFLNRLQEQGFTIEWRNRSEEEGCPHPQHPLSEDLLHAQDDIFPLGRPYASGLTR